MRKEYLILAMIVLFVSLTSATSIGTYEQNNNIQLYQTCNNCTYCNFTAIKYPNGTNILNNIATTKDNTYFYFDLNGGNLSKLGTYKYCYDCGNTAESETGCIDFIITPNGEESTTQNFILYMGLIFILIIFFIITLIGLIRSEHYIAKFAFYWVLHLLMVAISFIAWTTATNYLGLAGGLTGLFKIIFYVSIISIFPMLLLSLAWIFYIHTFNEHFQKLIDKGGNTDDAFRMAKRKSGGWFNGK